MGCDICYTLGFEGFLIKYKKEITWYDEEEGFDVTDENKGYICLECLKEKLNNI